MRSVYLDYSYHEFFVDENNYQEIVRLVKAHMLCKKDRHPFSEDNPCVGKNLCLKHLLDDQPSLKFLDESHKNTSGNRVFRYLNTEGYIYTSTEDTSDDASRDLSATLAYHKFVPPETITYRERTVDYSSYYASIYGNLNTASVIVMTFEKHSSEVVKGVFLLYNDGTHKELAKKGEHKQLFTRAHDLLAKTKDQAGVYHLPCGSTTTVLSDDNYYPIISQLESAMFDVICQLQPKQPKTDTQEEETQQEAIA